MSRHYSPISLSILKFLTKNDLATLESIYKACGQGQNNKSVYDALYRLNRDGLVTLTRWGYTLTPNATKVIHKLFPQRDGVWKIVIFDIPERKRQTRTVLRAKLEQLNFKLWQSSIWVSPYILDKEVEDELQKLARRYFIRLIKTSDINYTQDLDKLFPG
jgi:DNA-binding transcriptional regulator PaaX